MKGKYDFECEIFESISLLDKDIQKLIEMATNQLAMAYAPYSKFLVGAALMTEEGDFFLGCNQENASYPLCMCAERVALYSLGALKTHFKIKALAITAKNTKKKLEEICMPCGACRQVIQEFETRQKSTIDLYLTSEGSEIVKVKGISKLLPASFSQHHLL